jgi:hypothetical protein
MKGYVTTPKKDYSREPTKGYVTSPKNIILGRRDVFPGLFQRIL